jgi:hypothetical protein
LPRIFDLGPLPPTEPAKPVFPDLPPAAIGILDVLADWLKGHSAYLRAVAAYQAEHKAWHKKYGGGDVAVMLDMADFEACERDPDRYRRELPDGMRVSNV